MRFEGMQRYTQYLNWYAERYKFADRHSNPIATAFILLLMIACLLSIPTLLNKCDVKVEPKPVAQAQIKNETPKAFRMKSPTEEQMSKYHDLMTILQVTR